MDRVSLRAVGATAAAVAGAAAYLDGKYAISKDVRQVFRERAVRRAMAARIKALDGEITLYHMLAQADPNATALWFEHRSWTYAQLRDQVDRMAEILRQQNVQPGDFVAIFMSNSPEMVFAIYAITKLGAAPAMINASLRKETLLHCMDVANANLVVCTPDLTRHVAELPNARKRSQRCVTLSLESFPTAQKPPSVPVPVPDGEVSGTRFTWISSEDFASVVVDPSIPRPKRSISDVGVLIYTSGTSGMPKAVSCKNLQLIVVSTPMPHDTDHPKKYFPLRTYSCLPLFHGTGFFTGLCYVVGCSSTFCLGRKFSASSFSKSLAECEATRMLYVGELCRYLLKAAPSPYDKAHKCIVAHGNGMQGDVWNRFKERFGIDEIREVYRSTEGLAKFDNWGSGGAGAGRVGFHGPISWPLEKTTYLVKYDPETEEPYRDPKTGFCVPVAADEPGEAIGRVTSLATYSEYLNNPKANAEKMIRDVFAKGDMFQRTGDLLIRDSSGWVSFLDRTGDTFRWQGENVSAGEVRAHISKLPNMHDVVVYGVKLEGYDGQAGAAGITLQEPSPAAEAAVAEVLYESLRSRGLTTQQVPRLLRFIQQIEINSTFKHLKNVMKQRSWDPKKQVNGETVWYLNNGVYKKLDANSWEEIKTGKARL